MSTGMEVVQGQQRKGDRQVERRQIEPSAGELSRTALAQRVLLLLIDKIPVGYTENALAEKAVRMCDALKSALSEPERS